MVIDASVVVDVLLNRPPRAALARAQLAEVDSLHAPALIDAEVGQVLRRFALRGQLGTAALQRALSRWADMPIERHAHLPLLPHALGLRHRLTVYDALYVTLAVALDRPLLTADSALGAVGIGRVQLLRA
ncbi:MAG: type II toxin-antitoxin system VapC family toxin [Polyangiales bacterium]